MAAEIERVNQMEERLERCSQATDKLNEALEQMDSVREDMISLFSYYGSKEWYDDREDDIPDDVNAGVLSEDLVYDAITDIRDAAFHMLEQAADILKNRI